MKKKSKADNINVPVENVVFKQAGKVVENFKPPVALKPGVDWDGLEVELTADAHDGPIPNWNDILIKWGFDPDIYEASEPIKVSQWDAVHEGEVKTFFSYKGTIRKKRNVRDYDYAELVRDIKKHRKLNINLPDGDQGFVVCLNDWQLGKHDNGGLEVTVDEIIKDIDEVENRIRELRKIGRNLGLLIIGVVGDIIEGCDGNYSSQIFNVEVNRRQQTRIARRLIRDAICRWAKLFKRVVVVAVPGNHGENRKDGRAFTTPGDNDDVAVVESVAEILGANPEAYGHVEFYIPEDDVWIALPDVCGTSIGFFHGHITSGGGTPQTKIKKWWSDQSFANSLIGKVNILVTAHYHHTSVIEYDMTKIHIQCPARDNGSEWWENLTGERSRPGILTFVIDKNGYQDLQVL